MDTGTVQPVTPAIRRNRIGFGCAYRKPLRINGHIVLDKCGKPTLHRFPANFRFRGIRGVSVQAVPRQPCPLRP
jgi:hypothetical protein